EIEPPAAAKLGTVVAAAGVAQPGLVLPPIAPARVLALPPPAAGSQPSVHVLATRPTGLAAGINVYYDDATDGDYPLVGRQSSFALPVSLVSAAAAGATTIRVALLAGADGADLQRDSAYLRNWTGGVTEGRNDELLLILLAKDGAGAIVGTASTQTVEVLSVSGAPTLVSADTFDVPVLRGRRGTVAQAFSAGSFPDVWTNYEGWIIPRYSLEPLSHADFGAMISSGDSGYFRLGAYSGSVQYSPAAAYAERTRRGSAGLALAEFTAQVDDATWIPSLSMRVPSGYAPIAGTAATVSVTPTDSLPATDVQGALEDLDGRALSDSGTGFSLIDAAPFGLRKLVAGAGVTLAIVGSAIEISAETSGGPEISGSASDTFAGIILGEIDAVSTGWGWSANGTSETFWLPHAEDNFTGITIGEITEVTTGTGWAGPGTSYVP
ncbi:MAG TPA: hypothetical protein VK163_08620, partial [Opitutaceae bacterium]|nr:hypothetical protein [Opitutaceae bacterium]